MPDRIDSSIEPDLTLAGVCGVHCPSCTVYIGNKEDPARLTYLSEQLGVKEEDLICEGCRSEHRSVHCRDCFFIKCSQKKGVDFCGSCDEFPCDDLRAFQKKMPHRAELWESHKRIKEAGYELWFTETVRDNACEQCGTINSAYDRACRSCSAVPASHFNRKHAQVIHAYLKRE